MGQIDIYRYLREENQFKNAFEIAKAVNSTENDVRRCCNKLAQKGLIIKEPKFSKIKINYGGYEFSSNKILNYYKVVDADKEVWL